jgi:recombination protein RecT
MGESTAVALREKAETVKSFIYKNVNQIKDALPRIGVTPEAVARAAFTQCLKNPVLLDCDKGTLMKAIIEAAQLGLSFNLGRAYLVPFRNTKENRTDVQLIPGYLGLLDIARRSGEISSVSARAVYEGDVFTFRFGLESDELHHDPLAEPDAKKLTHVYAIVRLKGGGYQVVVLTRKQVESVRARSKAKDSGPWITDYEAMAIKTVLKRVLKLCPASVEMVRAMELDGSAEMGEPQHLATDLFVGDDYDIIEATITEEEPKATRTATVKDQLKKATKEAEKTAAQIERDEQWSRTLNALEAVTRNEAEADIKVSEATGGKLQSKAALIGSSIDQLKQVETHCKVLADE